MKEEKITLLGNVLTLISSPLLPDNKILFMQPEDAQQLKQDLITLEESIKQFERLKAL